jgi:MoaA/NifB/PqqE/SkfB family radical SAM enzyme
MGGACPLACAFHRTLHRCQPGGLSTYDLLDRLAYANKVGARRLYLVGGEPAQHPGFFELLRAAKASGISVITTETMALPFAADGVAHDAQSAGLDRAVIEIVAFDEAAYDAVTASTGQFASFLLGIERLREAGIPSSARLIVAPGRAASVPRCLAEIRARDLRLDAVVVLDDAIREVERAVALAGFSVTLVQTPHDRLASA